MRAVVVALLLGMVCIVAPSWAQGKRPARGVALGPTSPPVTRYEVRTPRRGGSYEYETGARLSGSVWEPVPVSVDQSMSLSSLSTLTVQGGKPWEMLPSGLWTQSSTPLISDPLFRQ